MQIGSYRLKNNVILAPMAGVTDLPFRELCQEFGAGLTVSEMVAANPALRQHKRTLLKIAGHNETGIKSVQILGTDPAQMADAASFNVAAGAQIIDINMGCPAKKVCSVAAGSALLKNETLVKQILEAVVKAVAVPVTLKIRTGWDPDNRNAVAIAQIAEQSGIAALTIHGRTRACKFTGTAEYETIAEVKQAVTLPIIANGDIDSAPKALEVLTKTGADGIMIGRAAQGNPWLLKQINYYLENKKPLEKPSLNCIQSVLYRHLDALYSFYGNDCGVKIARKHIGWYLNHFHALDPGFRLQINQAITPSQQLALIKSAFNFLTSDTAVDYGLI